jgi:hypothetical protein
MIHEKEAVERIRNKRGLKGTALSHVCSHEFCQPLNEVALGLQPALCPYVFVCNRNAVHVCTEQRCEFLSMGGAQTCPISGMQSQTHMMTSTYSRADARTWFVKHEGGETTIVKKTRYVYKGVSEDDQRNMASDAVRLLLYNGQIRQQCNDEQRTANEEEANKACATYAAQCEAEHMTPHMTDMYRLFASKTSRPFRFKILAFNQSRHDYYVAVIRQVWTRVLRFYLLPEEKQYTELGAEIPPRLDFQSFCFGVLYAMQTGIRYGPNFIVLPQCDFLKMHLPHGGEIEKFGIRKTSPTDGDKMLRRTFDNAIAQRVPDAEIAICETSLPAINPVSMERVIVDHEQSNVPIYLTSSGETLFMPVSRKNRK